MHGVGVYQFTCSRNKFHSQQLLLCIELAWQEFPSLVKPVLQVAQIAALSEVQAAPVTAAPFEQVQVLD